MGSDHPHRALAEKLAQKVATTWGRDEEFRDEAVSAILAAFDDVTGPLDKFKSDTAQALTETKVCLSAPSLPPERAALVERLESTATWMERHALELHRVHGLLWAQEIMGLEVQARALRAAAAALRGETGDGK